MDQTTANKISEYFMTKPIDKAWIFGSHARSEEKGDSDIDIIVVFNKGSKVSLFQYVHIKNDLEALTGKKVDLVEEGQLKPFARQNAQKEKVLIYEREAKG